MAKVLILDNPTGGEQIIEKTGQWVNNGDQVTIESDELAEMLLRNSIWKPAPDETTDGKAPGDEQVEQQEQPDGTAAGEGAQS